MSKIPESWRGRDAQPNPPHYQRLQEANHLAQCLECNHIQYSISVCEECGGKLEVLIYNGVVQR